MAKAIIQVKIDAEGWKYGEQNGLDTRVVHTVNNLHLIFGLGISCTYNAKA